MSSGSRIFYLLKISCFRVFYTRFLRYYLRKQKTVNPIFQTHCLIILIISGVQESILKALHIQPFLTQQQESLYIILVVCIEVQFR